MELTKEEKDLIVMALRKVPLQGTLETLPAGIEKIADLIWKIQGVVKEKENDGISERGGETV